MNAPLRYGLVFACGLALAWIFDPWHAEETSAPDAIEIRGSQDLADVRAGLAGLIERERLTHEKLRELAAGMARLEARPRGPTAP